MSDKVYTIRFSQDSVELIEALLEERFEDATEGPYAVDYNKEDTLQIVQAKAEFERSIRHQ